MGNQPLTREWTHSGYVAAVGRSHYKIICPWCGYHFDGFAWSLAGSGKRCPYCKSLHVLSRSKGAIAFEGKQEATNG